jgi:hypothetical protein
MVGGNERWLDFTPPPFGLGSLSNPIWDDISSVYDKQQEITLTIPTDSPLALSIS